MKGDNNMKKQKENQIVDGDEWFEDAMNNEKNRKSKKQPKKTSKKSTGNTEATTSNKKSKPKKPGVIASILEFIDKSGPISKNQIHKRLVKRFPDRNPDSMKKTIACQITGKKRPLRMEKEKGVKFDIDKDGCYSLKKGKK